MAVDLRNKELELMLSLELNRSEELRNEIFEEYQSLNRLLLQYQLYKSSASYTWTSFQNFCEKESKLAEEQKEASNAAKLKADLDNKQASDLRRTQEIDNAKYGIAPSGDNDIYVDVNVPSVTDMLQKFTRIKLGQALRS